MTLGRQPKDLPLTGNFMCYVLVILVNLNDTWLFSVVTLLLNFECDSILLSAVALLDPYSSDKH